MLQTVPQSARTRRDDPDLDRSCRTGASVSSDAAAASLRRQRAKFTAHERSTGRSQFVPSSFLVPHLDLLTQAGLSRREIERRSGVSRLTILRIERGELIRVHRKTACALLAVIPVPLAEQLAGLVASVGTQRRLRALVAAGWSQSLLARLVATTPSHMHRLLETDRPCSARTRAAVAALYDSMWNRPPPAATPGQRRSVSRSRRYAQQRGWVVAMGWDDDEIDRPEGQAQGADAPTRIVRPDGRPLVLHASARVEDLHWMLVTGEGLAGACARLDIKPDTLFRQLARIDRLDLWHQLAARDAA